MTRNIKRKNASPRKQPARTRKKSGSQASYAKSAALAVLEDNDLKREGSFIYYLADEWKFDAPSFWRYYNALVALVPDKKRKRLDRTTARMIFWTYSYTIESLLFHLSPNDGYRMKRFPLGKLHAYVERLHHAVDGYVAGYTIDEAAYLDLKNPDCRRRQS